MKSDSLTITIYDFLLNIDKIQTILKKTFTLLSE